MSEARPARFGSGLAHAPALDGVRALAVLLVLAQHWLPLGALERHGLPSLGAIGVKLFFVLSGLLITRILLVSRFEARTPPSRALRTFYLRRVLRIFPLYYTMLAFLAATSGAFRAVWPWYVTYLQNIAMARAGHFLIASHFWTLAIEEQFYLIWPLLLFLLPAPWVGRAPFLLVAAAIAWRLIAPGALGLAPLQVGLLTPASLDSLGLGALLAWQLFNRRRPSNIAFAGVGAVGLAAIVGTLSGEFDGAELGISLAAFALIGVLAENPPAGLAALFAARPLRALGRVSYGVYVYHLFVSSAVESLWPEVARLGGRPLLVAVELAVTLAVAALSWRFLERPFLDLKQRLRP